MGYEIDFLPVGNGEKSGDAIALRFGNLYGTRQEQVVVVVDGGTKESGNALVSHIGTYYGTDSVDIVVSSHPDADHASGLEVVLEELQVGQLWMHRPWTRSLELSRALKFGALYRGRPLSEMVQLSMRNAEALEAVANRKGIPIIDPFAGHSDQSGHLFVLGPSEAYYDSLLQEVDQQGAASRSSALTRLMDKALNWVDENWHFETLTDDGETSARNNSSVILALQVDDRLSLLTADAGAPAIHNALDYLETQGVEPTSFKFVQVPHHGSKRNVGPTVLDRLLGPKLADETKIRSGFVSAAADAPKHPAKKVTNAFLRRGTPVYSTEGHTVVHKHNAPAREGWSTVTPHPFYGQVEE